MKTIKSLALVLFITLFTGVSYANDFNEISYEVKTSQELPSLIQKMVKEDFVRLNNYFHLNNIDKLRADVTFEFYISKDDHLHIVSVESKDFEATDYVKQLLDNTKVPVADTVTNKKYKLVLKLDYRS
ncbi:MAG: hypothetical protein JXR22_05135 [Prolixibacteraceae bacterium]|nr:hypothetical protein [Prolixibacteraceae bacterium]